MSVYLSPAYKLIESCQNASIVSTFILSCNQSQTRYSQDEENIPVCF